MECIFASYMNKALLSIGSNEDKETNVTLCQQLLGGIFKHIVFSEMSVTKPYGKTYKKEFLNQLAVVYTEKDKDEVLHLLKSIEKEMGRMPADKENGMVKIDVDLVVWNEDVLKPKDIKRSYIVDLLPTIND